jgi:hypothetical protein
MRPFVPALVLALLPVVPARAQEPAAEPHRVTVGMYVNDIQTVDLTTYSYAVDLYLWFRWRDPALDPVAQFEFMNTFDPEAHVQTVLYDAPVPQPDGSLYQIVRHQGLFSAKFPLQDYPFDRQSLTVTVEDTTMTAPQLVYVPDEEPITVNADIRLPGYRLGTPRLEIRDKPYPTAFGDLAEPDPEPYSRAEFVIPISRPPVSGLLKTFIPVILIILSAAFALLLDPGHVEARIGLAITALLTLVAMQFTMLSGLPEVAYLTLIDQVYLASYLYILVVIGIVVQGTRTDQTGELRGDAPAAPYRGLVVSVRVTGLYLAAVAATVWINLAT